MASPIVLAGKRTIPLPVMFRALRHRNYRLWFIGQGISLIGTWMQTMAQQVLIYRLTGSAAALGLISVIGLIPLLPLSLWGGSIADFLPRRTIILITQAVMLVQALLMAALTWTGTIQIWQVYAMALILAAANAVDLPVRQSFTVDMISGKEDLTNAIGLNSAIFNGARAIGPALAGLVVAAMGEGMAFFLNGLSFIAVIISLLMMKDLPQPAIIGEKPPSVSSHMAEGLRFITRQQTILVLICMVAASAFLSMPYSTLMPVFASDVLQTSAQPVIGFVCGGGLPFVQCQSPEALPLGLLLAAVGVGAFIGALVVASLGNQARRGLFLTAGNLGFPFVLLLFAGSQSFLFSFVLMLVTGFSFVMQNALANTLLQLATPDAMRGRVMSVYTLTFQGMMRMGGLQAGLVSDWLGAPFSVGIGAAISLLAGLFVARRYPAIRKM